MLQELRLAVLSDFDGTIVDIDTCVYILENYGEENWKTLDEKYEKGLISLEECLKSQFATVFASEDEILNDVQHATSVRPYFKRLVHLSETGEISLMIVSAGLDFVIRHFLNLEGWSNLIEVYAPKASCTAEGIKLTFPRKQYSSSTSFKDDLVIQQKKQDRKVVYIGDGVSDYEAAKNADIPIAMRNSKLADLLKRDMIHHEEITDFKKAVEIIEDALNKKSKCKQDV